MSASDIVLLALCPRTRRFGIAAASTRYGGPAPRFVARPWRGMVYSLARDLGSVDRTAALMDQGWRSDALLSQLVAAQSHEHALCTIDAQGRFAVSVGAVAQRSFYRASRASALAISLGHGSAAAAVGMLDAFEADPQLPLQEGLLRGLEAGAGASGIAAESAFLRVMDPHLEFAYTDVTVDLDAKPMAALRKAHDALSPLYDYYAIRGYDPTVPRYPQWLAQQGARREGES